MVITPAAAFTNAAEVGFGLVFNKPVTGLAAGDLTVSGTATGCAVGTIGGSGANWTAAVTGCSAGTVVLSLAANAVVSPAGNVGPVAPASSAAVLVDRTPPTAAFGTVEVSTASILAGSSIPIVVRWTGADKGGAGIGSYDIARSTNGGAFGAAVSVPASPLRTTSPFSGRLRFRVVARDRAGNTSAPVLGPTLTPSVLQQTSSSVKRTGTWRTVSVVFLLRRLRSCMPRRRALRQPTR